jgi:hypothetical protein
MNNVFFVIDKFLTQKFFHLNNFLFGKINWIKISNFLKSKFHWLSNAFGILLILFTTFCNYNNFSFRDVIDFLTTQNVEVKSIYVNTSKNKELIHLNSLITENDERQWNYELFSYITVFQEQLNEFINENLISYATPYKEDGQLTFKQYEESDNYDDDDYDENDKKYQYEDDNELNNKLKLNNNNSMSGSLQQQILHKKQKTVTELSTQNFSNNIGEKSKSLISKVIKFISNNKNKIVKQKTNSLLLIKQPLYDENNKKVVYSINENNIFSLEKEFYENNNERKYKHQNTLSKLISFKEEENQQSLSDDEENQEDQNFLNQERQILTEHGDMDIISTNKTEQKFLSEQQLKEYYHDVQLNQTFEVEVSFQSFNENENNIENYLLYNNEKNVITIVLNINHPSVRKYLIEPMFEKILQENIIINGRRHFIDVEKLLKDGVKAAEKKIQTINANESLKKTINKITNKKEIPAYVIIRELLKRQIIFEEKQQGIVYNHIKDEIDKLRQAAIEEATKKIKNKEVIIKNINDQYDQQLENDYREYLEKQNKEQKKTRKTYLIFYIGLKLIIFFMIIIAVIGVIIILTNNKTTLTKSLFFRTNYAPWFTLITMLIFQILTVVYKKKYQDNNKSSKEEDEKQIQGAIDEITLKAIVNKQQENQQQQQSTSRNDHESTIESGNDINL